MAYISLYRKYRPQTFETLFGQDHVVRCLTNQVKTGNVGHAYLFTGSRGTGKTSSAKIFARAINCLHPHDGSPCGECEVCKSLQSPSSMDIVEIDAASNNGVDEIRDLREKIKYPPVIAKYKVYIIDEVHMLSPSAFNALLKTLEEPPAHAVFILATTEVHKLPATILSRCMRFDFRLVTDNVLAENMERILRDLGREYELSAVRAIAEAGQGSVRDMLSVADMCLAYSDGKLTEKDVLEVLGSSDKGTVLKFVSYILAGDTASALTMTDELIASGKNVAMIAKDVTAMLRDMLVVYNVPNYDLPYGDEIKAKIAQSAKTVNPDEALRILELFARLEGEMKFSTQGRVLFEACVARACLPRTDFSLNGIINRLNAIEKNGVTVKTVSQPASVEQNAPVAPQPKKPEVSAYTLWGKMINALRVKGMYALLSAASASKKIEFNGTKFTVRTENIADYRVMSISENKSFMTECLKAANNGNDVELDVVEPSGNSDMEDLNLIKTLADADVLKIL